MAIFQLCFLLTEVSCSVWSFLTAVTT